MTDMEILAVAMAYTNKAIEGGGGLKGANCTIKSITPITGGNRVTFEWKDNQGNIQTSDMDVMNGQDGANGQDGNDGTDGNDGQDGFSPTVSVSAISGGHQVDITDAQGTTSFNVMDGTNGKDGKDGQDGANGQNGQDGQDGDDGVGITSIVFKETDANGNRIYTVNLSDSNSYDIMCPKGDAGTNGTNGQDGDDGVGIASITKTGTSGLVDTYTITYTNNNTSTFTVTNGANGSPGQGIASGGATDQVLIKKSSTDYDTDWKTLTKSDVGLSNVPNVTTNDQTPTFSMAQTRSNIVSGDALSTIMGKIAKFFNDLKTVAFSGSYKDLSNKPQVDTMPTASADYVGDVVQYVGTTTVDYIHGYYYECANNGGTYSWVQTNVQPSNEGGHTIVNGAGTSMTARNALQFKGGLAVSDDSTNERTVVSDEYELITWADWQIIVANHEENLHPNAIIIDAPDADGDISVELMKVGWENPNPTASFAAQNIQLSSDDYDMLLWVYDVYTNTHNYMSEITTKGNGTRLINVHYENSTSARYRIVTRTDDTHFAVADAVVNGSANNAHLVPIAVYLIKTTASVKVSAIAESVSTSADKCMLSDGVTSVEDVLEDSGWLNPSTDIYYRKKNGFVSVKFGHLITASNSWENVYTLPEGYRPTVDWLFMGYTGGTSIALGWVKPNGSVVAFGTSGTTVILCTVFPID